MRESRDARLVVPIGAVVLGVLVASGAVAGVAASPGTPAPVAQSTNDTPVSEQTYEEPVPEPDDPYFEATAEDGSWISYVNPRDEYRVPYLGDGSGKLCVTLLNEAGEPVVGESVSDVTATIDTGEELEWHSHADPFVVEYPLTENYDRPLDADQFGTDPDLPQGDGYLDSHCLEWHGLPEDETVAYGEIELEGDDADRIEVVGYVQQAHDSWDTDVDPLTEAQPYEEAGGWTYLPDGSHGQAVVVLQLDGQDLETSTDDGGEQGGDADDTITDADDTITDADDTITDVDDHESVDSDDRASEGDDTEADDSGDESDRMPGFGVLVALLALTVAAVASRRW
ncbi:PGF-CTERM sorting domain-containing protein [Natrialba swarupiae]|uniref:PGF-CTERM sorting domain-containing protein n=1 Tax=Natrialba swarupiae TaxID=2448032 RepID=A0A5D5ARL3_9EURY|nr:PGF-CTERM sorting domain-containing protein [Natrialba swarupiae]TYT63505.1 PGF-CTERM sorting domain-containing protein [Natrialba swarupiae]